MSQSTDTEALSNYKSGLDQASARFLSRAIQHTLQNDWQTPEDFLQHFSPTEIMQSLARADALRAKLLVKLANVHEKIAIKKSLDSATEDLRLAIEEGITTPEAILEHFSADDRVKHLKRPQLWTFMFAEPFYKTTAAEGEAAHARAVRRMYFLLECAFEEQLLTPEQFADGIGFERMVDSVPQDELRKLVVHALRRGRKNEPLTEADVLDFVTLPKLLGLVSLEAVWQHVIIDRLAKAQGWTDGEPVTTAESTGSSPRSSKREAAAPAAAVSPSQPQPAAAPASDRTGEAPPAPEQRSEVVAGSGVASPDEARGRALGRLKEIERLPPRHEELSTPIVLSIESMYEDLLQASTDDERAECIRESFPNEAQLRTAMFALAELLEPSIDVTRPPICDADTDALVKLVVFEERKRKDGDGGMRRSSVRPPPLPMGRSASSIPAARVTPKNER